MNQFEVQGFVSFTIAIVLLFIGKAALMRFALLRKYSIPEPVIGGFLCATLVGLIYIIFGFKLTFKLDVSSILLLYFFAGIGLKSDFKTLLSGGKPLIILTVLAATYIVLQNLVGISVATGFGMEPKAGMMAGSISLIGGVGTAIAWAPKFVNDLGIPNAAELGVAANTIGLISACCIGGPIANYLVNRHKLKTGDMVNIDIGVTHGAQNTKIDYYDILWAWLTLNIALIIGNVLNELLESSGISLPEFVSCLIAGIFISNVLSPMFSKIKRESSGQGLALISDLCLGMFLTMALMSLKLWELKGALAFLSTVMVAQILMSVLFTVFIVFRAMGRDYEASVICSGFGGITLGSTATAIVNMTAVSQQYGAAHRAFIVVPLVCGFFIDVINALVINFFVGF